MHTKRIAAPRTWRIPKKEKKWTVTPSPGQYRKGECVPLLIILRDVIKCCDSAKEARRIVAERLVKADEKVVTDPKFPVGLMNSVSIGESYYRVILDKKGIKIVKTSEENTATKLVRVNDIGIVKNGKYQFSLHDGRNVLLDKKEYRVGDTLKIKVLNQEIVGVIEFKEGNLALITGGKHLGEFSRIKKEKKVPGSLPNMVELEDFEVPKQNVFVIGKEKSELEGVVNV